MQYIAIQLGGKSETINNFIRLALKIEHFKIR